MEIIKRVQDIVTLSKAEYENLLAENHKLRKVVEYAASYYHPEILKQEFSDYQQFNNLLLDEIQYRAKIALKK